MVLSELYENFRDAMLCWAEFREQEANMNSIPQGDTIVTALEGCYGQGRQRCFSVMLSGHRWASWQLGDQLLKVALAL